MGSKLLQVCLPEIGHGISSIDYLVTTFNFIFRSLEVSPKTYLRPNKSKRIQEASKIPKAMKNQQHDLVKSRESSVVLPHLPHSQAECQSQRRLGRCTGDDDAVDHPGIGSRTRKSGPLSCARAGTLYPPAAAHPCSTPLCKSPPVTQMLRSFPLLLVTKSF